MGCGASSEEINNLRKQVTTLKASNEQLSVQETALAEELSKVIKITQTDKEKAREAIQLLNTLLGRPESTPASESVQLDMDHLKEYFNSRLEETESQQDKCTQLLGLVNHYKTVIRDKQTENRALYSLLADKRELDLKEFEPTSLESTFEALLQACQQEKEIALLRSNETESEGDFTLELNRANDCIHNQEETIVVQNLSLIHI